MAGGHIAECFKHGYLTEMLIDNGGTAVAVPDDYVLLCQQEKWERKPDNWERLECVYPCEQSERVGAQ